MEAEDEAKLGKGEHKKIAGLTDKEIIGNTCESCSTCTWRYREDTELI